MATEKHHTGLDDEEFDRYDTFDDLVTDGVDPNRNGLFGELGRLIDQIKINNAANKLDDNVAVGEDRALTVTGNWGAVPHEELYASVHTDNNPSEAYALAREWTQLGNMMAENSQVMDATIRSTESGWVGPAAEVARTATLKLATWGGDAAQTSQYMGTRIADQGLAAERAKAAMPEPVNFDYEQMLRQGFATGGLAGLTMAIQDVNAASTQARTAHAQAAQVMSQMEEQSRNVDETTPRFVRPPEVTDGGAASGADVQGLRSDGLMAPSARLQGTEAGTLMSGRLDAGSPLAASMPGGSTTAALAGSVPGVSAGGVPTFSSAGGAPDGLAGGVPGGVAGGVPGGSAGGVPGAVTSGQRSGGGTYTPPKLNAPDMPDFGTTTAGYTPNTSIPGGHPGGTSFGGPSSQPDFSSYLPPGTSTGRNRDSNTGYVPPKTSGINPLTGMPYTPDELRRGFNPATGQPFTPDELRRGINPVTGQPYTPDEVRRGVPSLRGGMPGGTGGMPGGVGGGGGSAGGFGGAGASGAGGFGPRGGMPGGSYAGAVAAAEQAAARGGMPGMGQNGASGQPGMGGGGAPGGGRSGGGDDKEHRNKYAANEKVIEEPGRMVPTVIGEKSAKQLKEEQPG
jgi:hypothetical protein